jgi:AcrR family transcriptional regulator
MAPSTKEQLVLTAERLFALHGVDGVSLRQISAEAGNANNSAVQYHFGSKEHLVQAIFEYRIPSVARRRRLLAGERKGDLRSHVEAYLIPLLEEAEDPESYYLTFLMQLQRYGSGSHPFDRLPAEFQEPTRQFVRDVSEFLVDLPELLRPRRVVQAMAICLHASADRQLALRHKAPVVPYALHLAELFDGLVGFLQAPPSQATVEALETAKIPTRWRMALP